MPEPSAGTALPGGGHILRKEGEGNGPPGNQEPQENVTLEAGPLSVLQSLLPLAPDSEPLGGNGPLVSRQAARCPPTPPHPGCWPGLAAAL